MRIVYVVYINPGSMTNRIVVVVGSPDRVVVIVGDWPPGAPPSRAIVPSPGRNPNRVARPVNVLHHRPGPDVDHTIGSVSACISANFLCRFDDRGYTVDVFVPGNLQYRLSVRLLFKGDDSDILEFILRHHSLDNESMDIAFVKVVDPYIVDITIAVQIKVVDLRIGRIKHFLELLR